MNEILQQIHSISKYIQLFPMDCHAQYGEIIFADERGAQIKITRVKVRYGVSGYTPNVGEIHFYPWNKLHYIYVSKSVATEDNN